jgi:ATP:ADP antiporter, AAA family
MGFAVAAKYSSELQESRFDIVKLAFLSCAFFLVICAYTLTQGLKDSVFMGVVGKEYVPWAKTFSMLVLVPAILFYSSLVDNVRRYQLLIFYSVFFGLAGLFFTYYLGDPVIGLGNTDTHKGRIFGWLFFFYSEGVSPFVVSVFWAFVNSISSPLFAKKHYGSMVAASKVGGMIGAAFAWMLFSWGARAVNPYFSDVVTHQIVLGISAIVFLLIPFVIWGLMRAVPEQHLHGYEAVYQAEKDQAQQPKPGLFSGLYLLLRYPYVLGIFGMIFFYEVAATVLSYLRLEVAQDSAHSASELSAYLFQMVFAIHLVGFFISFIGTTSLLKWLGTKRCLLLIPILSGGCLFYVIFASSGAGVIFAYIALKAIHYAFSWPVRESLYIPTTKDIKFKSKSWIDAFGGKFAKTSGSAFNIMATQIAGGAIISTFHMAFFVLIVVSWFFSTILLGKRFERAVAKQEVIGL